MDLKNIMDAVGIPVYVVDEEGAHPANKTAEEQAKKESEEAQA